MARRLQQGRCQNRSTQQGWARSRQASREARQKLQKEKGEIVHYVGTSLAGFLHPARLFFYIYSDKLCRCGNLVKCYLKKYES